MTDETQDVAAEQTGEVATEQPAAEVAAEPTAEVEAEAQPEPQAEPAVEEPAKEADQNPAFNKAKKAEPEPVVAELTADERLARLEKAFEGLVKMLDDKYAIRPE